MSDTTRKSIFIDGHSGIVGDELERRLQKYPYLDLITLKGDKRRQWEARLDAARSADLTVLCLPDDRTRELCEGYETETDTRILDTSSTHRVMPGWTYGLPELGQEHSNAIRGSRKVTNPGCYALAIVLIVKPLTEAGIISRKCPLTIYALSGYSGGGKSLVRNYESMLGNHPIPVPYSLTIKHKHIDEIMKYAALTAEPVFIPSVGDFYRGIRVLIPINNSLSNGRMTLDDVASVYSSFYSGEDRIYLQKHTNYSGVASIYMDSDGLVNSDRLEIHLIAHESGHLIISGILDNLSMGSASTAEKNILLMLN